MSTLVFLSSVMWVSELVVFSYMGSSNLSTSYGSHAMSSTLAQWLSMPLMGKQRTNLFRYSLETATALKTHDVVWYGIGLLVLIPCSYCCVAKGVAGQDTSILAPMVPMVPLGEDSTKAADTI